MVSRDGGCRVEEHSPWLPPPSDDPHAASGRETGGLGCSLQSCPGQSAVDRVWSGYLRPTTGRSAWDVITATMSLNPVNTRFFSSSQPMPPVFMISTRDPSIASSNRHGPDRMLTPNNAHYM